MLRNQIVLILLLIMLCSCRTTTEYVDREVVLHDSIYITALAVDTVMQHDSIHIIERGDTVTTTIYKYIYKVRERIDTVYKERVDTFLEKKTVVKYKTEIVRKTDWGKCFWATVIGIIIGFVICIHKRKK